VRDSFDRQPESGYHQGVAERVKVMDVKLRPGTPEDAAACGRICYDAFAAIAAAHGVPCDFPSAEVATALVLRLLTHPGFFGVVAEADGEVVGSNFVEERSAVAGVGPITVAPAVQNAAIGQKLMAAVMERAADRRAAGVRLVQAAYHTRSLALYAKLGFEIREPLACMQGPPVGLGIKGYAVRPATPADLEGCNRLCRGVHGHDRAGEVSDALAQGTALVVEHDGRITGYSTGVSFFTHSVGQTLEDLKALIGAATEFGGPGVLVPIRNGPLFRYCLENGLRVVQLMTLMTTGLYNEPMGAYLPSIMY
jgi:predicted N-acetyltransferase YhbS